MHPAVGSPDDAPYRPAAHALHTPDPPTLYLPGEQAVAVAAVLPAGHAYPAVQLPEHSDDVRAGLLPYRPASHGPEHAAVGSPDVLP